MKRRRRRKPNLVTRCLSATHSHRDFYGEPSVATSQVRGRVDISVEAASWRRSIGPARPTEGHLQPVIAPIERIDRVTACSHPADVPHRQATTHANQTSTWPSLHVGQCSRKAPPETLSLGSWLQERRLRPLNLQVLYLVGSDWLRFWP